jgi:predicted enzyme related to lactoylglutathione lyase
MEKLSATTNALNWFEIPMIDVARAKMFYETIFDIQLYPMDMKDMQMLMFPSEPPTSGGALVKSNYHTPSKQGSIIYLNANPDLQLVLNRIDTTGGKIILPKTQISPEIGYMAMFIDSEDNLVALHSGK